MACRPGAASWSSTPSRVPRCAASAAVAATSPCATPAARWAVSCRRSRATSSSPLCSVASPTLGSSSTSASPLCFPFASSMRAVAPASIGRPPTIWCSLTTGLPWWSARRPTSFSATRRVRTRASNARVTAGAGQRLVTPRPRWAYNTRSSAVSRSTRSGSGTSRSSAITLRLPVRGGDRPPDPRRAAYGWLGPHRGAACSAARLR